MKKKSIFTVILVCIFTFCFSITSFAAQIYVDLKESNTDVAPQIINDRTMVPVRAIIEMIAGCRVEWIADKQQVEVYNDTSKDPVIMMQIGNKIANYTKYDSSLKNTVNAKYTLDSPPVIIQGRTFVPLRFISEALGYTVDYNVDNSNIYLFSPQYVTNQIGEGKGSDSGEAESITNEEINYILSFRTQSWLDLSDTQQNYVVSLIARWWKVADNYVDPNFDTLKQDLNHQMETYFRNSVDISLFETACDIRNIDANIYINAKG